MPIIANSVSISARVGVTVKEGVRSKSSSSDVLPLQFTTQPQSKSISSESERQVTFTCAVAGGYSPYTYQWKVDGIDISGATSSSYTFMSSNSDNGKSYSVVVTDSYGDSSVSNSAVLSVSVPPTITLNPASQSVDEYGNVTFTGAATSDENITYQWYKNGVPVGTNSTNYTLTAAASDNGATVYFTAGNATASATSSTATLTVYSHLYQLNGSSQYVKLDTPITLAAGQTLSLMFKAPTATTTTTQVVVGGVSNYSYVVRLGANGTYSTSSCTITVDGVAKTDASPYPTDGLMHTMVITATASLTINLFGARWTSSGVSVDSYYSGMFKNITTSSRLIPMNNKSAGANQPATVGTGGAEIINYNAANWVAI